MSRLLPPSLSPSPSPPPPFSLKLPANKRIATPVSQRLASITSTTATPSQVEEPEPDIEGNEGEAATTKPLPTTVSAEATPRRRSWASFAYARRASGSSRVTQPTAPPPYGFVDEPIEEGDGRKPVEGEKLAKLRKEDDEGVHRPWWKRRRVVLLIVISILLVGLALGLGIGLGQKKKEQRKSAAGHKPDAEPEPLRFPLGSWTAGATLISAATACTSNPNTWRCYPYKIGGATLFDLTIANTSEVYAPNSTVESSAAGGVPANLTVTSLNPFAIPFTNQSLTYISSPDNATSARLTWTFEMAKSVMASASMGSNGATAKCLFRSAVFRGTLYLQAPRSQEPMQNGGDHEWPYAVEIRQSARGGDGVPECRESSGGGTVGGDLVPQSSESECDCVYRNY